MKELRIPIKNKPVLSPHDPWVLFKVSPSWNHSPLCDLPHSPKRMTAKLNWWNSILQISPFPQLSKDTNMHVRHICKHTRTPCTHACTQCSHTNIHIYHFNPSYPFENISKFHIAANSSWMFASDTLAVLLNVPPNGQLWVIWKDAVLCGQQAAPGRQLKDKTIYYY